MPAQPDEQSAKQLHAGEGTDVEVVLADDHPVFRDGLAMLLDSVAGIRVVGRSGTGR